MGRSVSLSIGRSVSQYFTVLNKRRGANKRRGVKNDGNLINVGVQINVGG